jgi:hypothetical protein
LNGRMGQTSIRIKPRDERGARRRSTGEGAVRASSWAALPLLLPLSEAPWRMRYRPHDLLCRFVLSLALIRDLMQKVIFDPR